MSSSVVLFSSCPQSLAASESFPMSQLFAWGSQSTGVSALASFLPKNTQGWSPLEWTGWISFQSNLVHTRNLMNLLNDSGTYFLTDVYGPSWGFPGRSAVKNPPTMWETRVWSLGWEDPLEEGIATLSRILVWRTPWTEEPDGLWSMGLQRVGRDWTTKYSIDHRSSVNALFPVYQPLNLLLTDLIYYILVLLHVVPRMTFTLGLLFSIHQ